MMEKDVPRHLAPVIVKYYFIQDLHSPLKLEVRRKIRDKSWNFDFKLHAPLLRKIFAILLYNTITVQNMHKKTNNST